MADDDAGPSDEPAAVLTPWQRRWLVRVGIGLFATWAACATVAPRYRIPSGAMMPTVHTGDHILTNPWVYMFGDVERGDVIVFRYPVDPSQLFFKRVVGLPGDEVAVEGRRVSIKRAGASDFEELRHVPLDEPCVDPDSDRPVGNCTLYEETVGERSYVVRYKLSPDERNAGTSPAQIWKVPAGHLFVMGDNRNDSLDSRRWTVPGEAVRADGLLSTRDLRELTEERLFSMSRPGSFDAQADGSHDHVIFEASHRALVHDLALDVWREPSLGADAVRRAGVAMLRAEGVELHDHDGAALVALDPASEALRRHEPNVVAAHTGEGGEARHAVVELREPAVVLALGCGTAVCTDEAALVRRLAEVLDGLEEDPSREARELLPRPDGPTQYHAQFQSRHAAGAHVFERRFASAEVEGARGQVRLRAFLRPGEGLDMVGNAALRSLGMALDGQGVPEPTLEQGDLVAWALDHEETWATVAVDPAHEIVVVLECGKAVCAEQARAQELLQTVSERVPAAADDRRNLASLLEPADLGGLAEVPIERPALAEHDRVRLEATSKSDEHRLELEVWLRPPDGLASRLGEVRNEQPGLEDEPGLPGAYSATVAGAQVVVVPVESSQTLLRLRCQAGLCPGRERAVALAERAARRAVDPEAFVDPQAEVPLPFVPIDDVKGRADRVCWPPSRFWLPVQ